MDVAASATSAARDYQSLAGRQQLAKEGSVWIGFVACGGHAHHRSGWHGQEDVGGVLAMRLAAGAATTRLGPMVPMMPQVAECGHAGVDDQHDRAAGATIPSIGSAAWNVGLVPKRGRSVAASAAGDKDPGLVSERWRPMGAGRAPRARGNGGD